MGLPPSPSTDCTLLTVSEDETAAAKESTIASTAGAVPPNATNAIAGGGAEAAATAVACRRLFAKETGDSAAAAPAPVAERGELLWLERRRCRMDQARDAAAAAAAALELRAAEARMGSRLAAAIRRVGREAPRQQRRREAIAATVAATGWCG